MKKIYSSFKPSEVVNKNLFLRFQIFIFQQEVSLFFSSTYSRGYCQRETNELKSSNTSLFEILKRAMKEIFSLTTNYVYD